jgi:predicted DNA-binding protein (MmcQ/YjbR family)
MTRTNMERLEAVALALPDTHRVDVEAWEGEPTFRVRNKVFVFSAPDASSLGVKLPRDEAEAVVATDPDVVPTGYGLGRHGWVTVQLGPQPSRARWDEVTEWIRTSYTLVAPKSLARTVLAADD